VRLLGDTSAYGRTHASSCNMEASVNLWFWLIIYHLAPYLIKRTIFYYKFGYRIMFTLLSATPVFRKFLAFHGFTVM
jgi:hypothetical protein